MQQALRLKATGPYLSGFLPPRSPGRAARALAIGEAGMGLRAHQKPLNLQIGQRLREQRQQKGLSQSKLGNAVDLTFQQIQKYESGRNTIGAALLHDLSCILDVPISYFFDGLRDRSRAGALLVYDDLNASMLDRFRCMPGSMQAALSALLDEIAIIQERQIPRLRRGCGTFPKTDLKSV